VASLFWLGQRGRISALYSVGRNYRAAPFRNGKLRAQRSGRDLGVVACIGVLVHHDSSLMQINNPAFSDSTQGIHGGIVRIQLVRDVGDVNDQATVGSAKVAVVIGRGAVVEQAYRGGPPR
jgi:hypothetical protein